MTTNTGEALTLVGVVRGVINRNHAFASCEVPTWRCHLASDYVRSRSHFCFLVCVFCVCVCKLLQPCTVHEGCCSPTTVHEGCCSPTLPPPLFFVTFNVPSTARYFNRSINESINRSINYTSVQHIECASNLPGLSRMITMSITSVQHTGCNVYRIVLCFTVLQFLLYFWHGCNWNVSEVSTSPRIRNLGGGHLRGSCSRCPSGGRPDGLHSPGSAGEAQGRSPEGRRPQGDLPLAAGVCLGEFHVSQKGLSPSSSCVFYFILSCFIVFYQVCLFPGVGCPVAMLGVELLWIATIRLAWLLPCAALELVAQRCVRVLSGVSTMDFYQSLYILMVVPNFDEEKRCS